MRITTQTAALLIAIVLAGCQHKPTIKYPKLPAAGAVEAGFDCAAIDDAILKSEAVRWVMREDGARLLSPDERAARGMADVATTIAAGLACFGCISPVVFGEEGHTKLDVMDRRLVSLLKLKQDKQCDGSPTAIPGMTDLQLYDTIVELLAEESDKKPGSDVGELRDRRAYLLDKLRP